MSSWRIDRLMLALALVSATALGAQTPSEEKGPKKPKPSSRLFASDSVIKFTLTADFKAVFKNRDTLNVPLTSATLTHVDASGKTVTVPVQIAPRGHFRIQAKNCAFTPLRVVFTKDSVKGTLFGGQKALKLATHCQKIPEYDQYTLREYFLYRALNLLTDKSFKGRLAKATYVDTRSPEDSVTRYAMFIESENELEDRFAGKIADELRGGKFDDMDSDQMSLVAIWEYFIGNTDWSLYALHNVRLLQTRNPPAYYPIAYDFDFSGFVSARYATPDPRIGIKKVQERLYRGPCRTLEQATPVIAKFKEQRQAIYGLFTQIPDLDRRWSQWAREYIDEFYTLIDRPSRLIRELGSNCVPSA
jgi:hypothetical protein